MFYEIDGNKYKIKVNRKRIKNIYIRYKNNEILLNIPYHIKEQQLSKILDDNIDYLKKVIKREERKEEYRYLGKKIDIVIVSNLEYIECVNGKLYIKHKDDIDKAYKLLSMDIFNERLKYVYAYFKEDIPYPILKSRKMTSRWGVCNRKNNSITLNTELIKYDIKFIDYVIIHELAHFVHFNHSSLFWDVVSSYCRDYKELRKLLREQG